MNWFVLLCHWKVLVFECWLLALKQAQQFLLATTEADPDQADPDVLFAISAKVFVRSAKVSCELVLVTRIGKHGPPCQIVGPVLVLQQLRRPGPCSQKSRMAQPRELDLFVVASRVLIAVWEVPLKESGP